MAVPPCVADNQLLARCMDTSDEWIVQRTGIKERRVSPDTYRMLCRLAEADDKEAFLRELYDRGLDGNIDSSLMVADLAFEASKMALENAGVPIHSIDLIIDSTTVPDYAYPHTGCVLQGRFGLTSTPALNLQQGCAGFVYALAVGDQMIRTGMYDRVLVVGAELLSSFMDFSTRGRDMAVLFADGAGAVVLQSVPQESRSGIIAHHLHTNGSILQKLYGEIYGSSTFPPISKKKIDDGRARPRMEGRTVFVQAVNSVKEVIVECLEKNSITIDDVDLFIFHQANLRIIDAIAGSLKIPPEKSFNNLWKYGNTSAASVPMCLHEALLAGRVKEGDLLVLVAFGTGFSWGASLLRW